MKSAIFGLLPDALSSAMGNQSAKPPVLYSFYGRRKPSKDAVSLAH